MIKKQVLSLINPDFACLLTTSEAKSATSDSEVAARPNSTGIWTILRGIPNFAIAKFGIKIVLICAVLILAGQIRPCFAAFTLSIEPYEGGSDIRFGRIDTDDPKVTKEVTIRVTTDIAKQYRVYQRLERPFITPDNIEVDRNQFKMYTLINSNTKGTLERLEEYPVAPLDTLLYTSNTTGESDYFKAVYLIEPLISQSAGSYYGRMQFILFPIDSTQDQKVETVNMYLDLTNEGAVEISTDTGAKFIRISSSDLDKAKPEYPNVYIKVKGNLGSRYRIYQQLSDTLLKSTTGDFFDLTKLTYKAVDSKSGQTIKENNLSDLKLKSLIYTSDDLGSAVDMAIKYEPAKEFPQDKANLYTGAINYSIELDKSTPSLEPGILDAIDLELNVEPIFRVVATSIAEDGVTEQPQASLLQFGEVGYKTGTKESIVKIKIESNLQRPYLVTQKLSGPLQNQGGDKIPSELFTFKLSKVDQQIDTGAKLKFTEESVVEVEKDASLFVSNANGASDEFLVTYKLKVTPDTRGGDYSTGISYSLSEL